jgi:hypothetical protein
MIISKLRGGLGNQLFQYALGQHLATLNQTELKLDTTLLETSHTWTPRTYGLDAFNIRATIATTEEIKQTVGTSNYLLQRLNHYLGLPISRYYHQEPHFHFHPPTLLLLDGIYLDGYWQSEKYFTNIAPTIREQLTPQKPFSTSYQNLHHKIHQCEAISIHVRRGDYTNYSKSNHYLQPCDVMYYTKALKYLVPNLSLPTFFVFSDDIAWVKYYLHLPYPTHFVEGNTPIEDLLLMASCKHHIIANSTFSWWGAWLNPSPDKIVIAPQKWFSTERFNTQDLLPAAWIRL